MRAVLFGDLHVDAGSHLGLPDAQYGTTRLRDAETALRTIHRSLNRSAPQDTISLIFLGDLGRTPRPAPLALRVVIDALAHSEMIAIIGNHDYTPQAEGTAVHVVARAVNGECLDRPAVYRDPKNGLQIGVLPWSPPMRLFEQVNQHEQINRLAEDRLYEYVAQLSQKLDDSQPSILVGHWEVGDDVPDFIRAAEPVLSPAALEVASRFDVHVFGHDHRAGQVGDRTYRCGPPLRSSFGEADLTPGYMVIEW